MDYFGELAVLLPGSRLHRRVRSAHAIEPSTALASLSCDDLAELRLAHSSINDAVVPFIRDACAKQHQLMQSKRQNSDSEHTQTQPEVSSDLSIAEAYPGHFGKIHERLDALQAAVFRIEKRLNDR